MMFGLLSRGVALSGAKQRMPIPHAERKRAQAVQRTRQQWQGALQVDETSGWMSLMQQRPDVLRGLCTVLTLCGLAKAHQDRTDETPDIRVIRGAISAADQCGHEGSRLTPAHMQALSSAARRAASWVADLPDASIEYACTYLDQFLASQEHIGSSHAADLSRTR